jgi:haloalkane dehalogenase
VSPSSPVPRALYPFDGHELDLDGLRYHYLDEGSGDPLVMLHGNPTWSIFFRDLVENLRDEFRAIVPDHIGCGYSDKPDDSRYEYTLSQRTDDLEALLAHLGLENNLTLVCHDWGGMIGMAYAARHPERIRRLVLMNTAAFHLPEGMHVPPSLAFMRRKPLGPFFVQRFNLFSRGATWLATSKRMSKKLRDAYCSPYDSYENRIATLRFVQDVPLRPGDRSYDAVSLVEAGLEQFGNIPILLLWGEKDFVFKARVLAIFEKVWPQAEVHRFPDAGHYVLEDAGDEIAPIVREFLVRTSGSDR